MAARVGVAAAAAFALLAAVLATRQSTHARNDEPEDDGPLVVDPCEVDCPLWLPQVRAPKRIIGRHCRRRPQRRGSPPPCARRSSRTCEVAGDPRCKSGTGSR
jgi:hypothetical protein